MIKNNYIKYLCMYKAIGYKVFTKYENKILYYANSFNVDPEIIFFLITNEQLNRGSPLTRLMEYFITTFLPSIAIKKDISIGLAQIKISTAKNVLKKNIRPKQLIDSDFNIYCVTRIVKNMNVCNTYLEKPILKIVKKYTLGDSKKQIHTREQKLYLSLSRWSYKYRYFYMLQKKELSK